MKKLLIFSILFTFIYSCKEDINVTIAKSPGKITGKILPADVACTVELYQGELISSVNSNNGFFEFKDVDPGVYRIMVKAETYGSVELPNIKVSDGEGYDVGVIELSLYPHPLYYVNPPDGRKDIELYYGKYDIYFIFKKRMTESSVEEAFKIDPQIDNISFRANSSIYYNQYTYHFNAKLNLGTTYTFTLDTTVETILGERMEFPYSSTFTTEYFKVVGYSSSHNSTYANWPILIAFNGDLTNDYADHITITPSIPFHIDQKSSSKRIYIYPTFSWMADTTMKIIINKNLSETGGAKLQQDTTFTFVTAPLNVVNTTPYSGQYFIDTNTSINIRMNNLLDESSIAGAVQISPQTTYSISTFSNNGYTQFTLNPDSLKSNTEYTVLVNGSLKDYFGGSLKSNYSFIFHTR